MFKTNLLIFVVLECLLSSILFLQLNFRWSAGIIHEGNRKYKYLGNSWSIWLENRLHINDAFIKIQVEIENKISCIENVQQLVQISTIYLHAKFSSDIFGIWGNLFHNKYSDICFANILLVKHFSVSNFLIVN